MQSVNQLVIMYIEGLNYDFSGIKVTIKSLREYYNGEIVVITKDVDEHLNNFLLSQNVEIVSSSRYKVLFPTSPYNNKIIYSFLYFMENKERLSKYRIFYCDISDVFFRNNPFSLTNESLWFSLEDKKIEECNTNTTWCKVCYTEEVFEQIQKFTVINSGLIMGNFANILELYKKMTEEMASILTKINYPITDQIIVNKLVYKDLLPCFLDNKNVNNISQGIKDDIDNNINHQYKNINSAKEYLYTKYQ